MRKRGFGMPIPKTGAAILTLVAPLLFSSCSKGSNPVSPQNSLPETYISSLNVSEDLSHEVVVEGRGEDLDGRVEKFVYWFDSEEPDTIYGSEFMIEKSGLSLRDHTFNIVAFDNDGGADPTPAVENFYIWGSLETMIFKPGPEEGQDTYIENWSYYDEEGNLLGELNTNQNHGDEPYIKIEEVWHPEHTNLYQKRGLFKFDISALPEESEVISATLFLRGGVPLFLDPGMVYCHEMLGDWDENVATWNNTNHLIGDSVWSTNFGDIGTNWYYWFVDDLVKEWKENPDRNYGVAIFPHHETQELWGGQINSSDFPYYDERPQLEINYLR